MGLGNSFEQIDENIVLKRQQYKEKCRQERIDKPFVVYQNSIGNERFASIKAVQKYLEEMIPLEFSVYREIYIEEDLEFSEPIEKTYRIKMTVKLIKE